MLPLLIIEHRPVADALFGLGHTIIGFEIALLMSQAAPEALDKHIVHPASLAIHVDFDVMVFEYIREILAGKLTTLVTVKDILCAVGCQGFFQCLNISAASRLLARRYESTFLERQSMIAPRCTKPLRIGMYVRSVPHT
jgi:hypothetical protein